MLLNVPIIFFRSFTRCVIKKPVITFQFVTNDKTFKKKKFFRVNDKQIL